MLFSLPLFGMPGTSSISCAVGTYFTGSICATVPAGLYVTNMRSLWWETNADIFFCFCNDGMYLSYFLTNFQVIIILTFREDRFNPCPRGTYSGTVASVCTACPVGSVAANYGSTACTSCSSAVLSGAAFCPVSKPLPTGARLLTLQKMKKIKLTKNKRLHFPQSCSIGIILQMTV